MILFLNDPKYPIFSCFHKISGCCCVWNSPDDSKVRSKNFRPFFVGPKKCKNKKSEKSIDNYIFFKFLKLNYIYMILGQLYRKNKLKIFITYKASALSIFENQ